MPSCHVLHADAVASRSNQRRVAASRESPTEKAARLLRERPRRAPARRVGVVHEEEVVRRGIVSCLQDDPLLLVVFAVASAPPVDEVDVVVASPRAMETHALREPVVIFATESERARMRPDELGRTLLDAASATGEQLILAVRSAAAGMRMVAAASHVTPELDERERQVVRLLSEGASTRVIAQRLSYSERTIKTLIQEIESDLGASTRAQAVAEALRRGLI